MTSGPNVTNASEDGAALLDAVDCFLGRRVIYPSEHTRHAHVLWCAHTHLMDCWESTPRLYFKSPEAGSGKTRALEVSEHIVANGLLAMNMTPAYLIRCVSSTPRPTILYDEIDTVFGPKAKEHEDIRAVINSGHRQGAVAGRCMVMGNKVLLVDLPSYGPVALAGLGDLPDTIMDRAVVVPMKKRTSSEEVEPWRRRIDAPKAAELGKRLAIWADSIRAVARDYWPEMPEGVEDRDADRWEALLAVADLAGGHWPEIARAAAVADVADKPGEKESQGVLLLTDIRGIFMANNHYASNNKPALKTPILVSKLAAIEESPWKSINRGWRWTPAGWLCAFGHTGLNPATLGGELRPVRASVRATTTGTLRMRGRDMCVPNGRSATESATTTNGATETTPSTSAVADVADVAAYGYGRREGSGRRYYL